MGIQVNVVHIKVNSDFHKNDDVTLIDQKVITAVIDTPGEIPLFRDRSDSMDSVVDSNSGVFLFDIIPTDLYTKWQDNVERNDLLIQFYSDENGKRAYITWQVSEVVGEFRSSLIWKKALIAPYNGQYMSQVANVVELYKE